MTPRSITFTVHGTPKPKGSSRAFVISKAGFKPRAIITNANTGTKDWEHAIRDAAQGVAGDVFFDGAVALHVAFYLQRPKSVSERKRAFLTTKPDLSKLIRAAEDPLTGILWKDDSQVVAVTATKAYAGHGDTSRAQITVTEVLTLVDSSSRSSLPLLERTSAHV